MQDTAEIMAQNLGTVPESFDWNPKTGVVSIRWAHAGKLVRRFAIYENKEDPRQTHEVEVPIDKDPPASASAIVSILLQPLEYPYLCPDFTAEFFAKKEPQGDPWLKHGRTALVAGVSNGTVPYDCTTRPFKSGLLGLFYER